jgi:hypothetical protein
MNYILVGQSVVPEPDVEAWAQWFDNNERIVNRTNVGPHLVSTVFLGLDHNFGRQGPPLLFETMVFQSGDPKSEALAQQRCSTWLEAETQHHRIVDEWKRKLPLLPIEHAIDLLKTARIHGVCRECGHHTALDYCRSCDDFYWIHQPGCLMFEPKHDGHRLTIVPFVEDKWRSRNPS